MSGSASAPGITGLWCRRQQGSVLVAGSAGGSGRYWRSRHVFDDQNVEVERAEPNSDYEKPGIHFAGNPVEADQVLFHRDLTLHIPPPRQR
jgi:hypothetical protein